MDARAPHPELNPGFQARRLADPPAPFAGDEEEADGRATRRGKRTNYFGTTWRLLPYDDPSVGVFLSREGPHSGGGGGR